LSPDAHNTVLECALRERVDAATRAAADRVGDTAGNSGNVTNKVNAVRIGLEFAADRPFTEGPPEVGPSAHASGRTFRAR